MPAVPIKNADQYMKAIEVLNRVGGTWHGVGDDERYLLVTPAQYAALVEAKIAVPEANGKAPRNGQKSRKTAKS